MITIPTFPFYILKIITNNKNMKKILFIIILCMFSLLSCQSKQHKKINVIDKTIKLNEEIEVKYPSINDSIDNLLLDNVKNTYNYIINNYDTIPNFSYQSYVNKKYISYLVNYKYLDKEMIQAYNYDLNNGKEIYFNISKIIEEINSNHNFNYNLNSLDQGFLNIIINNQNIDIYLSKYLTNKDIQTISVPFKEEYLLNEKIEILPSGCKKIALTFDDGPSTKTKEIVDLLQELNIKATFFVLGCNVKYYKDELEYIYEQGHEIGNHSYSHPNFKNLTLSEGLEEIEKTQDIIYEVIKHYPRVFRFPYGAINKEVLKKITLPTVLWSADSLDWKRYDSNIIINKVKKETHENGILLFHDFKYYNYSAIKTVINDLKKDGYTFVTLSELFGFYSDDDIKLGNVYYYKK